MTDLRTGISVWYVMRGENYEGGKMHGIFDNYENAKQWTVENLLNVGNWVFESDSDSSLSTWRNDYDYIEIVETKINHAFH